MIAKPSMEDALFSKLSFPLVVFRLQTDPRVLVMVVYALQLSGLGVAQNATARIEDVSKSVLNKIPVSTLQVMSFPYFHLVTHSIFVFFYSDLRLGGAVGARMNVGSSYSERGPVVAWVQT